jgi:drug/metabolite transporter (DMT)-like permease
MRAHTKAYALALASGILFGLATPASKAMLDSVGPFTLAGLLYLGAALATGGYRLMRKEAWKPAGSDRWRLLGSIVFGGILGPVFLLFGLQQAHAGSVSIWLNLELVWTAALGASLFREHIKGWTWLAVILVVAASAVVSLQERAAGPEAGALVALACLCWGLDNHFTARITTITAPSMTLWKGLAAGATNLAIGLGLEGAPGAATVPLALVVGAFSYGLSIVWYVMSARQIGATRAQVLFSTAPLWGILAAVLWLRESWTVPLAIAIVLVGVAIWVLSREKSEVGYAKTS